MSEYRISKYNPAKRINGAYTVDEWTSISDIGKPFAGVVFTYEVYKKVETAYVNCAIELLRQSAVSVLSVVQPEYYETGIHFPQTVADEQELRRIIMDCLQEKCWAKLEGIDFFIHFGYDYYMYIGTSLGLTVVNEICKKYSLFCEVFPSPYCADENRERN